MHIVYVIAPGGGPESYVKTLVPWFEGAGHCISVVYTVATRWTDPVYPSSVHVAFAPSGSLHYYLAKFVGRFGAWSRLLRLWESAWAVYRALERIDQIQKIDLVEVTEGLPISSIRKRWTVAVRAHGSDWSFRFFCQDGDRRNDAKLIEMESQQLSEAHAVSAISQHLTDHLSTFCQFPGDRIRVIPYPIDQNLFYPNNADRANSNPPALLTIGRLEKRKGVDVLFKALPQVWARVPELQAYLLGSEADLKKEDLVSRVPDKLSQVIFPGFVEHLDVPSYYQRATIYVTPTRYETFAYTILEAMACGVPVIASCTGAIPELVDDGITGLLVPPGDSQALADAITALLDDPARRERMGQRAREKAVAEYSVDKIMAKMLDFYQRALSQ